MTVDNERLHAEAGPDDSGERLDRFLSERLTGLSRTRVQNLIKQGHVRCGGVTLEDAKYRVKPGQRFELTVPPVAVAVPQGEAIPLHVVYEDDALIVIDKPAGLVVHPGAGQPSGTLVNALIAHCGESLSGIGGVARPGIVHRLDKDTSGLLVAAKNDHAHQALAAQFADHSIERSYVAVVWGMPRQTKGRIEGNIGRDKHNRKKMAVVERGGKAAVTHYRVLRRLGDRAAIVACRLETGRTHQIRVHLATLGHSVIGDPLYGGRARRRHDPGLRGLAEPAQDFLAAFGRQALHAKTLGFRHPRHPEDIRFESEIPPDINALIGFLE